ncbi:M36 family metallopeptidase [Aquimonas sp.]|uniref:M36 family metallopeptidase n=1 Tax=Aquimonas sp. TaxID=1872588 RepID=UPI0037BFB02B
MRMPVLLRHTLSAICVLSFVCAGYARAQAGSLAEFDARTSGVPAKLATTAAAQSEHSPRLRLLPWTASTPVASATAAINPLQRARELLQSPSAPARSVGAQQLRLHDLQRLPGGAHLLRFVPERAGVEIFGERINLLLDADGHARAVSGGGSGDAASNLRAASSWALDAGSAASAALSDYGFVAGNLKGAWQIEADPTGLRGPYLRLQLPALLTRSATGAELHAGPRLKRVWFRRAGTLRPAWYVETAVVPSHGPVRAEHYAQVIDAASGELLLRMNQSAHQSFRYQAYAEPHGALLPQPGPQGRLDMPHPTAQPDGYVPPLNLPGSVELSFAPLSDVWPSTSYADRWLGPRDGSTKGNNVDVYADLVEPDGFSPGDLRARLTAAGEFMPGYDLSIEPDKNSAQIEAGIVNAFYLGNYLHDWFYLAGFDEAAGNAQDSNFGRGGLEGDPLKVETLDFAGVDNASMVTLADGESSRLQLLPFRGPWAAGLRPPAPAPEMRVQIATFGPTTYALSAPLAAGLDASGDALDGCQPLLDAHAGQIVLLDRGSCTFVQQALNAQAAGALGLVIANNQATGYPGMDGALEGVLIPAQGVSQADGLLLREQLAAAAISVEMHARRLPRRDSAMDAAIVVHEWGHFISNRLVGDATGLSNHQARAMGEGWADFHALLMLVRPEDALSPQGANFSGSYGVMNFVSAGLFPSFSPNASYFGIRRFPYSTRREINPLSFGLISNAASIPDSAPRSPAAPPNNNASVHNAGEVWGSLLWECYAGLLRDTLGPAPRLSFVEAQRRMSEYLVAGYKLTPNAPTYTEARDALLAAMAVSDLDDLRICGSAFASRGAGLRAKSPSRASLSLQGVQESFVEGGDLAVDALELIETDSCDADGVLDAGEQGLLRLRLRNAGSTPLGNSSVVVESPSRRLSFPQGDSRVLPPSLPLQQFEIELPVVLGPGIGREAITFIATPNDLAIDFDTGIAGSNAFAVDFDTRYQVSRSDRFDAAELAWATALDEGLEPELAQWRRQPLSALQAVVVGPGFGSEGTSWLISPPLQVATDADLVVEFDARYSFEAGSSSWYDGGVIELSTDGGASWRDVSEVAVLSPDYGGALSDCCDNPLSTRRAFVGNSPGWPQAFVDHRIDFGRALAGLSVQLRFGVATDAAVATVGWEIDQVRVSGIGNTPFPQVVADATACTLGGIFGDGFEPN